MSPAEVVASVLLLTGGLLSLVAAVGLLRLPDVAGRLQAATKPQVLGLLLVLGGVLLVLDEPVARLELALAGLLQLVTAPVLAQLVGRAAYRAGSVRRDLLVVDDLGAATGPRDGDG